MGLLTLYWLCTISNASINDTTTLKWLTGMISHSVVNNHKLSRSPAVSAGIGGHVSCKVTQYLIGKQGIVTKDNSLLWVIATINPTGVSRNNLIEKGLVSI
jgi:hypothetical protein